MLGLQDDYCIHIFSTIMTLLLITQRALHLSKIIFSDPTQLRLQYTYVRVDMPNAINPPTIGYTCTNNNYVIYTSVFLILNDFKIVL